MLPRIHYGAWVVEEGNHKRVVARLSEDDFLRELKLALLDLKDIDAAFERVRMKLVQRVREAVA